MDSLTSFSTSAFCLSKHRVASLWLARLSFSSYLDVGPLEYLGTWGLVLTKFLEDFLFLF